MEPKQLRRDQPIEEATQNVNVEPQESDVDCLKQRANFAKNKLNVQPVFEPGTCEFKPKLCNQERCYCVGKTGNQRFNQYVVPLGHSYDCIG